MLRYARGYLLLACFFISAVKANVITGRQICFTACKIPPTDFYPCYIETPEGKMCVCPDSDYKYNDVCFSRSILRASTSCGGCQAGATCYTAGGNDFCVCDRGSYLYKGSCVLFKTNEQVETFRSTTTAAIVSTTSTVATTATTTTTEVSECSTPCYTNPPTSRCVTYAPDQTKVCVCSKDSFLVGETCVSRDLLSPGSLNYQCRTCIPNSSCYVYRRQTVCICDPGYFIYRGACQPIVVTLTTTPEPTTTEPTTPEPTTPEPTTPEPTTPEPTTPEPTTISIPVTMSISIPKQCTRWPIPGNSQPITDLYFKTGDIIQFRCKYGQVLMGPTQSRCMEDGRFEEVYPVCVPDPKLYPTGLEVIVQPEIYNVLITQPPVVATQRPYLPNTPRYLGVCAPPMLPANGLPSGKVVYYAGEVHIFVCQPGYIPTGTRSAVCQIDGTFGVVNAGCQKAMCPAPKVPAGALPFEKQSYMINEEVIYKCKEGFTIYGNPRAVCLESGIFSSAVVICISSSCPAPVVPQFGIPATKSLFSFGETFEFKCIEGYVPTGTTSAKCGPGGSFGPVAPVCSLIRCLAPIIPNGGVAFSKGLYDFNEEIELRCHTGFELTGEAKVKCDQSGTFNTDNVACTAVVE